MSLADASQSDAPEPPDRKGGRRLLLLRHANANYDTPSLDDHDAPLSEEGRAEVQRLGAFMDERGYMPTHVLCSSARRTQETSERLATILDGPSRVEVFKELYLASPQRLLEQIEGVPAAATTLLVVAHNPGIGALAHHFAEGAEVALHQQILASYPPAALSVFDSGAADWRGFKASRLLLEFVRPEDL